MARIQNTPIQQHPSFRVRGADVEQLALLRQGALARGLTVALSAAAA
jgi:hypothetical protein